MGAAWAPDWVTQRDVCVVGLGRSGEAAARALLRAGGPRSLLIVERGDSPELRARATGLGKGVEVRHGDVSWRAVVDRGPVPDLVVVSPGVPPSNPVLRGAANAGVPVWSEPELAWRLNGERTALIAVTGTNGKTSTTELLGACLGAPTTGNIGTPMSDLLAAPAPPPLAVAELSSFQLQFTERLHPTVAVLLNLAPDHLDWHADLDEYAAAKARIWAQQDGEDWAVVNADDAGARTVAAAHPPPGRLLTFTAGAPSGDQVGVSDGKIVARLPGRAAIDVAAVGELPARGPHNLANALAASAAAFCAGAGADQVGAALVRFTPGPHRLELVATIAGVRYVNDSKATNPHAAAAALGSYPSIVWIAGGLAKGLSFEDLGPLVRERVRAAVTIGSGGPQIAELARAAGVEVVEAGTLAAAVPAAARLARPGDAVLLAPACASMDQFRDYGERGEAFRAAVARLDPTRPAVKADEGTRDVG